MEKIKDALEKAKEFARPLAISKSSKNNSSPAIDKEVLLQSLSYTESAVVDLDPVHLEKNRIVAYNKNDPINTVFDLLRTQVLQKMEENNWRTIGIVSPTPEAGKTMVAINLSMSIAHQPQKTVVLVDFDLRKPKVAKQLGIQVEKSMNELLGDKADISQVMVNPGIPRLTILPTMYPVYKSAETLSSAKVVRLIKELKERYDSRVVVFDMPPLLNADDAMVLLPQVDCVLMVVGNGMSTADEIEECMRLLPNSNLVGVVLNKAEVEPAAYYY